MASLLGSESQKMEYMPTVYWDEHICQLVRVVDRVLTLQTARGKDKDINKHVL